MKRFAAILLVIVAVASGWFLYTRGDEAPTTPEGYQTAPVTRGAIEAVVSASGSIEAARSQALSFATAGTIAEVLVSDGDTVTQGQPLARLDTRDMELNLKQAQASLAVSQAQLERASKPAGEEEIAAAQAAVAAAAASLNELRQGPSEREKELARLAIDQAKNSLWAAQGNRDAIKGNPLSGGGSGDAAEAQVLNAELAVHQAELNYEQLLEPASASAIQQARLQVAQAESTLATLQSAPNAEDLAVARAQVAQAQVGVDLAMGNLNLAVLRAPFTGYIAAMDLNPGDTVAPGAPVLTLVEPDRYHIAVTVDETEIGQVAVGQQAQILLDAYPEEMLQGTVARVDLVGAVTQGIVTYNVTVDMEPSDLAVRPMMTAAVDMIVARKEEALLVPIRALRRDRQGRYVEELRNGAPARLPVSTGLTNAEYAEVLSGLEEGQQVIVSSPRGNVFGPGAVGGG